MTLDLEDVQQRFPDAYATINYDGFDSPYEMYEESDTQFYVVRGELRSQSHDEYTAMAFRNGDWIEIPWEERELPQRNTMDETVARVFRRLLEKFGEQVKDDPATLGIADERDDLDGTFLESAYDGLEDDGGPKELAEVAPPGWEGTVKKLKGKKGVKNPWALAWSMKGKGYTSHRKKSGAKK